MEKLHAIATATAATDSSGTGFQDQAKEFGVNVGEVKITSASRRTAALENPKVLLTAEQLAPGEFSGLFTENGAIHLLYCLSADDAAIQPFDHVKDAIALNLAQQKYRSIVDEKLSEAVVEWNYPMAEDLANQTIQ